MPENQTLRTLSAMYWKPLLGVLGLVPVGWKALIAAGIPLPALSNAPFLLLAAVYIGAFSLFRFPRVSIWITRVILGRQAVEGIRPQVFRGPRSYTEAESEQFLGRNGSLSDFRALIDDQRFVILEGESGCGKSSFIKVLVTPLMRQTHLVLGARVLHDPIASVGTKLLAAASSIGGTTDGMTSAGVLSLFQNLSRASGKPICLILDQFEEIFLTVPEGLRREFAELLVRMVGIGETRLILVTRTDFLDLVLKLCREADQSQRTLRLANYFTLNAFAEITALAVLRGMLRPIAGGDPILVTQLDRFAATLVEELLRPPRDVRLSMFGGKSVLPVEMQTVGMMIEARGVEYLSEDGLLRVGGKQGLMRAYLNDAKAYVFRTTGVAADQSLLLLRELVSTANTKARKTASDLCQALRMTKPDVEAVMDAFHTKYLVNKVLSEGVSDEIAYELMHDHLARIIVESNDPILQEARDAADRLAFWSDRFAGIAARQLNTGTGFIRRMTVLFLYQPVPVSEIHAAFRVARTSEEIGLLRRSVRVFCTRAGLALLVVVGGGWWLVAHQDLTASGSGLIFDGFQPGKQSRSGFSFRSGNTVDWYSGQADLLLASRQKDQSHPVFPGELRFFIPYEGPPFSNGEQDKALSGMQVMSVGSSLGFSGYESLRNCPASGYTFHWVAIQEGAVYCVRAREGRTYAKIKVTKVFEDRVSFDWVYQPTLGRGFQWSRIPRLATMFERQ